MEIQIALPVATLVVNLFVTGAAEAHQITFLVRSTLGQRYDVMYLFNSDVSSLLQALLTQRVLVNISVAYLFPFPSVPFVAVVPALELLVVLFHLLGMFLAVNTVGQVRTAGKAARSFWFPWHKPRLLSGQRKSLAGTSRKACVLRVQRYLYSFR